MTEATAQRLIETLQLQRHPEGGWYRETWRSATRVGERAIGTAIYFLLEPGQSSAWHRVDADEFWLWHAGAPLALRIAGAEGADARRVALGPDVLGGQHPQALIPAGHWQATRAEAGWALVSCIVAPGFEFSGFAMAAAETAASLDAAFGER
ncbi:MAG: cupin domain-containing protein [Hyphomonadaceae bacterium]